jgi:hypothetical protein
MYASMGCFYTDPETKEPFKPPVDSQVTFTIEDKLDWVM